MPKLDLLTGKIFGKLKVGERVPYYSNGRARARYQCKCSCGADIEVLAQSLTMGQTASCGCDHDWYRSASIFLRNVVIPYRGTDCLTWPFQRDIDGYGRVRFRGKSDRAHRAVCIAVNGEPPSPSHHAAHSCGNGHLGCVNPTHLSWKTPVENKADELVHGTRNRGERNGSAKLSDADVRLIRDLAKTASQRSVARQFGLSSGYVSRIVNREIWRHVT